MTDARRYHVIKEQPTEVGGRGEYAIGKDLGRCHVQESLVLGMTIGSAVVVGTALLRGIHYRQDGRECRRPHEERRPSRTKGAHMEQKSDDRAVAAQAGIIPPSAADAARRPRGAELPAEVGPKSSARWALSQLGEGTAGQGMRHRAREDEKGSRRGDQGEGRG